MRDRPLPGARRDKRVSRDRQDDFLERIKDEIRAEADAARDRAPLPRRDPPPRSARAEDNDGIERDRLEYALGDLTGPHYIAFIDHVYRAILKRRPDDAGSSVQLRLLAAGAPKAEVIGNLRWSPEGRRVGVNVRGLLPRYALSKLVRVPVLGYFLQWGLVFAGLPMLLRNQRAGDHWTAAQFNHEADTDRELQQRIEELRSSHHALSTEHDRRSDELRHEIRRLQLRVDALEHQSADLQQRTARLQDGSGAIQHELGELRHYVHAANHWLTTLQNGLGDLERLEVAQRADVDAFVAGVPEDATAAAARRERHRVWAAAVSLRVPDAARLLDLGSGDGGWLSALRERGLDASGVEANAELVARSREAALALGTPAAVLERCADGALDGVSLPAALLAVSGHASGALAAIDLLRQARRALKPGGWIVVRCEREPWRAAVADASAAARCAGWIEAAGFATAETLPAGEVALVLARRGEADGSTHA